MIAEQLLAEGGPGDRDPLTGDDIPESVACGERLFDFLARQSDWSGVRSLLADADARLGPPRTADAGRSFNRARSADLPADLDDCARLLFASHLRSAPATARTLFNSWPGPVTRDALFAARGADQPEPTDAPPVVPLAEGTVLAVAGARGTGDLVVATDKAVVLWRPDTGRVLPVCRTGGRRVVGLRVSPDGERVFVLKSDGSDLVLDSYAAAGDRFEYRCQRRFPNAADAKGGWALHPCGTHPVLDVLGMRLHLDPTLMHDLATGSPGIGPSADLVLDAADGRR